jgi:hypothetical protein
LIGKNNSAKVNPDPYGQIFSQQDGTVQIGIVEQSKELSGCGDPNRRLRHATDHHPQPKFLGTPSHPETWSQASTLNQFDVDRMESVGTAIHIRLLFATLVGH